MFDIKKENDSLFFFLFLWKGGGGGGGNIFPLCVVIYHVIIVVFEHRLLKKFFQEDKIKYVTSVRYPSKICLFMLFFFKFNLNFKAIEKFAASWRLRAEEIDDHTPPFRVS